LTIEHECECQLRIRRRALHGVAHSRIDPFPLGTQDVPDRLLIPETLYGREREIDALQRDLDAEQ